LKRFLLLLSSYSTFSAPLSFTTDSTWHGNFYSFSFLFAQLDDGYPPSNPFFGTRLLLRPSSTRNWTENNSTIFRWIDSADTYENAFPFACAFACFSFVDQSSSESSSLFFERIREFDYDYNYES
jgi:hypothetical protein